MDSERLDSRLFLKDELLPKVVNTKRKFMRFASIKKVSSALDG